MSQGYKVKGYRINNDETVNNISETWDNLTVAMHRKKELVDQGYSNVHLIELPTYDGNTIVGLSLFGIFVALLTIFVVG